MEENENRLVCRCKGVKYFSIKEAINTHKANTVASIQHLTGASTGCGRCMKHVEKILNTINEKS